jgi:hypothetical protein
VRACALLQPSSTGMCFEIKFAYMETIFKVKD